MVNLHETKAMKKVLILFILISSSCWIFAQEKAADLVDPVIKTIQDGDAEGLAAFFNVTVELSLPEHENTYSSSQGEMIMKDFFKKYPPDSFTVIQKGTTDSSSRFAICSYLSGIKKYQVYIYLKKEKEEFLIQKITFEEKK
jgi:hypothetical protein